MTFSKFTIIAQPFQQEFLLMFNHLTVENYSADTIFIYSNKTLLGEIQPNTSKTFLDVRSVSHTGSSEKSYNPIGLSKIFFQTSGVSSLIHVYNYGVKF